MPEPPHQTDMRNQALPPQRPRATAGFVGSGSLTALLLSVTRPEDLPAALKQHEKPVVIENTQANAWLIYWLKLLYRYKDIFIIGWLLLQAFAYGYNIQQYDWHVKFLGVIEVGGTIKLTPRTMTPPAGEE
jgi:hypothetical protein